MAFFLLLSIRLLCSGNWYQAGLGSKVGVLEKQMSRYERGENPISIITFCMIVVELMIDMAKLLPESTASEKGEVEKTLNLVRECKKFRNQELYKMACALNKSIQMGEEEGREAGKIKVAKNLLKAGISVDIILQTTGLSKDELKKHDKTEVVNFIAYKTGENMKDWRLARGRSQEDLGNEVGLTGGQIRRYEQGTHIMTIGKLCNTADELSTHAKTLLPKISELIEKGNVEVEKSDEDREGENGVLDLVREYNKIEDEEIRDKFYSLIMSVSKRIQIDKEKGKKIGEIEVAKNLVSCKKHLNYVFLNFLNLVLLQLLFIILYSCSIEKCIFGNKNPSLYRKEFMSNSYHYLGFMVNEYVL